jgi:hypothetical protein
MNQRSSGATSWQDSPLDRRRLTHRVAPEQQGREAHHQHQISQLGHSDRRRCRQCSGLGQHSFQSRLVDCPGTEHRMAHSNAQEGCECSRCSQSRPAHTPKLGLCHLSASLAILAGRVVKETLEKSMSVGRGRSSRYKAFCVPLAFFPLLRPPF